MSLAGFAYLHEQFEVDQCMHEFAMTLDELTVASPLTQERMPALIIATFFTCNMRAAGAN